VELQGEAFFKVAKGSSFKVKTSSGIVTVYGTLKSITLPLHATYSKSDRNITLKSE